jgi:hypothetical protein
MSWITDSPRQRDAPLKLRADQPVDSFNRRDSLEPAVFPAIELIQKGTGKTSAEKSRNEFDNLKQRSPLSRVTIKDYTDRPCSLW